MKNKIAISIIVFALLSGSAFAWDSTFTPAEGEYTTYVVKWFDDIKSVAAKFGMSVEDLMAYNSLTSEKLEKRQVLKIPKDISKALKQIDSIKETVRSADQKANKAFDKVEEVFGNAGKVIEGAAQKVQEGIAGVDSVAQSMMETVKRGIRWEFKDSMDISLILPLGAQTSLNDQSYDYYSGALLAIKDLSETGAKINLKVYDSKDPATDIRSLDFSSDDLIIGPVEPAALDSLLGFFPERTAVISPLDPKGAYLAAGHPNFLQVPSSADSQYKDVVKWISEDNLSGGRIILISEKDGEMAAIAQLMAESGLEYSTLEYGILEGRDVSTALEEMLAADETANRIVIASDKEAFVNDAVRNLNLMTFRGYDITLYAPSKIRNFETVDIESLHNIRTHVSTSYFVNYDSDKVKSFLPRYRALFCAEPTPFAYQGYDTVWYLVSRITSFGQKWPEMLDGVRFKGLQTDILFTRVDEESGYVNSAVRRVIYEDDFSVNLMP